jgi:hypothetical protein
MGEPDRGGDSFSGVVGTVGATRKPWLGFRGKRKVGLGEDLGLSDKAEF